MSTILHTAARPFVFVFLKIAEPRVARIIQFGMYVCLTTAGHYVITDPPSEFVDVLGGPLIAVLGWFLTLGGIISAIAVLPGVWWLERIGVIALWTGLGMFVVVAVGLGISIVGAVISLALGLSLVERWREIRLYQLAPRER